MQPTQLHIVCFDIPYPPTYGGAIDVFYRIKALKERGVGIILHCTYKGTLTQFPELESLCTKVYYYRRSSIVCGLFSRLPMSVATRPNRHILQNLLSLEAPILYEGLISCGTLNHPALSRRKKYFRECNVEHHYYRALAHASHKWLDKLFYHIEARRLEQFEKVLTHAHNIIALAHQDEQYFQQTYPSVPVSYVPCFSASQTVHCPEQTGTGILYHGNLNVEENLLAAQYILREVAPRMPHLPFVVAGRYSGKLPNARLKAYSENVRFVFNPDASQMSRLISEAQIHLLLTFQSTGLKLKLLNVLFEGRHVVCNPEMVCGTELASLCHIVSLTSEGATQGRSSQSESHPSLLSTLDPLYSQPVPASQLQLRREVLQQFNPQHLATLLLQIISH